MYQRLEQCPDQRLILTVTRRLALRLMQQLNQDAPSPRRSRPIFAVGDWINQVWQSAQLSGICDLRLLSSHQEQVIWSHIVKAHQEKLPLLQPLPTVTQLMTTWKLLNHWQLDMDDIDWSYQQEGEIFYAWAGEFEHTLESNGWITSAQVPTMTATLAQDHPSILNLDGHDDQIEWVGFDDLPPFMVHWFETLESLGITNHRPEPDLSASIVKHSFANRKEELTACAQFAKAWVKEHEGAIAIVVPDLIQQRALVEEIFNQVCDPDKIHVPSFEPSKVYNISAGLMLSDYPIIQVVFSLLDVCQDGLNADTLRAIINTPFLDDGDEQALRWSLFHGLKEHGNFDYESIHELGQALEIPKLLSMLNLLQGFGESGKASKSYASWTKWLKSLLEGLDWPGPRRLSSAEYQVVLRFMGLMDSLEGMDLLDEKQNLSGFIHQLKWQAQQTPMQPESNQVQIQIMGLLEASGQEFDAIWVTGLHSEAWPPPPKPNPFIPMRIQHEHQMPHSSAQRELHFASQVTESLKHSAQQVIFSFHQNDEAREYLQSPLIQDIDLVGFSLNPFEARADAIHDTRLMTLMKPVVSIPLKDKVVKGGVGIIADQAACPFKAFATHRMRASEPDSQEQGVSFLDRGIWMHSALEALWRKIKSHEALCQLETSELSKLIDKTLIHLFKDEPQDVFVQIEQERLSMLLMSWFDLERQRQPFEVIGQEKTVSIELAGFELKGRIDRIDATMDGQAILIDYKSGQVQLGQCLDERPMSPQLPLYCFADFPKDPKAIVFAQLRRESCKFIGLSDAKGLLPGVESIGDLPYDIPSSWPKLLHYFKDNLDRLSLEFVEGHCQVDPYQYQVCQWCQLSSFCRIGDVA